MKTTYRTLDAAALEELISAAVAAPSVHAPQPWRYRLDRATATLELHAAPERMVRDSDPYGRALHLSAGASLFNLRIAIAHMGWNPVTRLLPGNADPTLLATVRLAGPRVSGSVDRTDLYGAIWRRHTSRFPLTGRPLPSALLNELIDAARMEGAGAYLAGRQEADRLLALTAEGEQRSTDDLERPAAPVPAPAVAVITTPGDTPMDWLRAGQAMEHMVLLTTFHGVQVGLLHQALDWPDLRRALRGTGRGPGHVQMLLALGYGPANAG